MVHDYDKNDGATPLYHWVLSQPEQDELIRKIQSDLEKSPYKYPDNNSEELGHFENGHYLHSNQYYFAKSYFQSSGTCDKLAQLLANKIRSLDLRNTTLIGFRGYTGLLLNKTKSLLKNTEWQIEYGVLEQIKDKKFAWQFIPDKTKFNENFVVVLPVTCTCSTYIRIRKHLQNVVREWKAEDDKNHKLINSSKIKKWRVRYIFINIFLIQDLKLKGITEPVYLADDKSRAEVDFLSRELSELYWDFNWKEIRPDLIVFKNSADGTDKYVGYPIIKLYSTLSLPEKCTSCFPLDGNLASEKNIFLTHDNFETPNLLIDLPKYAYNIKTDHLLQAHKDHIANIDKLRFTELFFSKENNKNPHLYGHYTVNSSSYLSYVRGNAFFFKNKKLILEYFNKVLSEIMSIASAKKIIFISSSSKHSSTFLDEIATRKTGENKTAQDYEIYILRFDPQNEFIDNFMSNYKELLENKENDTMVIFFEEVISQGKTFKLLSNYLKHYRYNKNTGDDDTSPNSNRHGFDYVFSLIDRTPFNTRQEILKKLTSNKNIHPKKSFISFFHLNVPVLSAAHLGNPLEDKVNDLKRMIMESHLDALKLKIGEDLPERSGKDLPEENEIGNSRPDKLKYFPFENDDEQITNEVYNLYHTLLTNRKLDLLKLYAAHEINTYLANRIFVNDTHVIDHIITSVWIKMEDEEAFFTSDIQSIHRKKNIERNLLHDTVIKILARHPFTYYDKIDNTIFKFCLTRLEDIVGKIINDNGLRNFSMFRNLKFYIKRLMELDSSALISAKIIRTWNILFKEIGGQLSPLEKLKRQYLERYEELSTTGHKSELEKVVMRNLGYKIEQLSSFMDFLLSCYKESIFKNHYRSVKLEQIINSGGYPPELISRGKTEGAELVRLIQEPYYLLTGMIKAENIYLINSLKELHIEKLNKFFNSLKDFKNGTENEVALRLYQDKLMANWLNPYDTESILNFYFKSWKSDPVILSAQKFLNQSRVSNHNIQMEQVRLSVANMLKSITLLADKNKGTDFTVVVEKILQAVVGIIQPGIEDGSIIPGSKDSKLQYALCVKYANKSTESESVDNIFVISSDKASNGSKINRDGLIYNLLQGMCTSSSYTTPSDDDNSDYFQEQSLLAAVKAGNEFYSFHDSYSVKENTGGKKKYTLRDVTFDNLYKKDCKVNYDDQGLPLLAQASMGLFFRLSGVDLPELETGKCRLIGKAVLIITCKNEADSIAYRDFMSNEKVRLLLLIKENLLEYLSSISENETFWDLMKSKARIDFIDLMKHGIMPFFDSVKGFLEGKETMTRNEIIIIDLVNRILETQINTLIDNVNEDEKPLIDTQTYDFSESDIRDLFETIMELPNLTSFPIRKGKYDLNIRMDNFKCPNAIYHHVIPELFVNIRKHTYLIDGKKEYKIHFENNILIIENPVDQLFTTDPQKIKHNGGRQVCHQLCTNLGIGFRHGVNDEGIYRVSLTFK